MTIFLECVYLNQQTNKYMKTSKILITATPSYTSSTYFLRTSDGRKFVTPVLEVSEFVEALNYVTSDWELFLKNIDCQELN